LAIARLGTNLQSVFCNRQYSIEFQSFASPVEVGTVVLLFEAAGWEVTAFTSGCGSIVRFVIITSATARKSMA
jgi:hypothetical protein